MDRFARDHLAQSFRLFESIENSEHLELASLIPCDLYLTTVLSSEGNVEAFKKSKRIYDTINFVEFGALSDIQLRPAIALLEPTRVHVKELRIRYGYLRHRICSSEPFEIVPESGKTLATGYLSQTRSESRTWHHQSSKAYRHHNWRLLYRTG